MIKKYRHTGKRGLITQDKNLSLRNLLQSLSLGLKEDPITEDHKDDPITYRSKKKTKSLRNLKRTLSLRTLKRTLSLRALTSVSTLNDFCAAKTFFGFLVIVYDRVGDGEKFSCKNFGLGRSHFHATVT